MLLVASLILLSLLYAYHHFYQYWPRHRVPCLQPHFTASKEHLGLRYKRLYDLMKAKGLKHCGVYLQLSPVYVISDLIYIKNILTKDFHHFPHRGLYYNEARDPLSAHIFNLSGPKWRTLRTKLNPIFTSHKLRLLFPILQQCGLTFRLQVANLQPPVDIKALCDSYISDVIESCTFRQNFGMDGFVRRIFNRTRIRRLKGFVVENFPNLGKLLDICLISKDASDFFLDAVGLHGGGFVDILAEKLNPGEVAAQCFIFFIAGMSTSPSAMAFAMYELAKNQQVQERARREVLDILDKYHGEVTYEGVLEMKYLDKVFNEALRKYPPAAYLNRRCERDYQVPGSDVTISKGTNVVIPVLGVHYDAEWYPEPEKFDPERFGEVREGYAFLPFGEGPRSCLGMRFGLMQSKVGLISLLKDFQFGVSPRTEEPLKMKPGPLVLTPEGGIWLDVHEIGGK